MLGENVTPADPSHSGLQLVAPQSTASQQWKFLFPHYMPPGVRCATGGDR